MGLTDKQARDLERNLNPTPPPEPEPGYTPIPESHKQPEGADLRGVPILSRGVGGAITGSRPGDSSQALEQAGRDILQGMLRRTRRKDYP